MWGHLNAFLGLARTGNYLGMTEADLEKLQRDEPGIVCALSPLLICSPNVLARPIQMYIFAAYAMPTMPCRALVHITSSMTSHRSRAW